ncbi:hypothetical protein [Nocardia sp. CA-120079]|uniref:hypothetical protein n=1 Tax=Nocardia sp. CA-120079 TaxID=3239974 RepID=UPI003D99DA29
MLIVDAPAPVELLADALQDKPARVEWALHEMAAELSARASGIDLRFVGDGFSAARWRSTPMWTEISLRIR